MSEYERLLEYIKALQERVAHLERCEYIARAGNADLLDGLHADATGAADAHVVATDANGNATVVDLTASRQVVAGYGFKTASKDMSDDTAVSWTGISSRGFIILTTGADDREAALIIYRAESSPHCTILAQRSTLIEASTVALSGTTGTDGRITVSATEDGTLYIENRRGGGRTVTFTIFGR